MGKIINIKKIKKKPGVLLQKANIKKIQQDLAKPQVKLSLYIIIYY